MRQARAHHQVAMTNASHPSQTLRRGVSKWRLTPKQLRRTMPSAPTIPSAQASPSEKAAWLRLSFEQLGALAFHLLARIGTPEAIFSASPETLARHAPAALAHRLGQPPPTHMARRISNTLAWADAAGHSLLVLTDPAYPQHLLTIGDPPLLLYVDGDPKYLVKPGLAIVGARNATAQGIENARAFAYALACRGLCIISGMALGIDGAAHAGALTAASQGGGTVAVMGTGLSVIYPQRHLALAQQIRQHGALVSELPLEAGPLKSHFPRRNRLVAGLSSGVLVVEAARESGSLITARLANDTGREVFAMPGSIHSPLSRGCHDLIRQGATLVECAQDVIGELSSAPPRDQHACETPYSTGCTASSRAASSTESQDSTDTPDASSAQGDMESVDSTKGSALTTSGTAGKVGTSGTVGTVGTATAQLCLDHAMGHAPVHIDTLCQHTRLPLPDIAKYLLTRELAGDVLRLPDGLYQRMKR